MKMSADKKEKKTVSFLFMYGLWIKYEQQQISTMKRKSVQKKYVLFMNSNRKATVL